MAPVFLLFVFGWPFPWFQRLGEDVPRDEDDQCEVECRPENEKNNSHAPVSPDRCPTRGAPRMRRRTRAAALRAASPMTMRAPMSWSVEAIRDLALEGNANEQDKHADDMREQNHRTDGHGCPP